MRCTRSPRRFATALLLTTALANAQQAHRAELPAGPLLTFANAKAKTGVGEPHTMTVFAVGCDDDVGEPQVVWVNRGNVRVLRRLDRHRLLIQSFGEPYALLVVDAEHGTHRVLCEGAELVDVHGDDVLYLGDNRWGKGDHFLYARSWRQDAEPVRLSERTFVRVPIVAGNLAIGVSGARAEVWAVSLVRGSSRKLLDLPDSLPGARFALSPGGQWLAVGTVMATRGQLAVYDVGSSELVRRWRGLPIAVSPFSSFSPTLEVGWHDEEHVVCSESRGDPLRGGAESVFVRRSLTTGEVVDEEVYGPVELHHRTPPAPGAAAAEPTFSVERDGETDRLLQRGREQPLASFAWREQAVRIALSPDGRYAVEHARGQKSFVLHREGKPALEVLNIGAHQLVWLPAAAPERGR